jgi:hypothetical protein
VPGIESDVFATFIERLGSAEAIPASVVEGLAASLAQDKLPKPDDLVALYSEASGEPLA